jgi:hypothetical protein
VDNGDGLQSGSRGAALNASVTVIEIAERLGKDPHTIWPRADERAERALDMNGGAPVSHRCA